MTRIQNLDYWLGALLGMALIVSAWQKWLPYSLTETLGFVTGAGCVYLVVKQQIWNFPLGIANNIFFLVLFAGDRLYGDAGLQIVYIALAIQGWYWWLHGGENRTVLQVNHASPRLLLILAGWACWEFIEPPVRGYYARRVCLVGAESTGKTTLAQALAAHYHTTWVA